MGEMAVESSPPIGTCRESALRGRSSARSQRKKSGFGDHIAARIYGWDAASVLTGLGLHFGSRIVCADSEYLGNQRLEVLGLSSFILVNKANKGTTKKKANQGVLAKNKIRTCRNDEVNSSVSKEKKRSTSFEGF